MLRKGSSGEPLPYPKARKKTESIRVENCRSTGNRLEYDAVNRKKFRPVPVSSLDHNSKPLRVTDRPRLTWPRGLQSPRDDAHEAVDQQPLPMARGSRATRPSVPSVTRSPGEKFGCGGRPVPSPAPLTLEAEPKISNSDSMLSGAPRMPPQPVPEPACPPAPTSIAIHERSVPEPAHAPP